MVIDAETGRPLEIDLDTSYEDFCDLIGQSGRFRLEAIDANGHPVPRCIAIVEVHLDDEQPVSSALPQNAADALPAALQLIGQLVQSNTRVMEALASAFGQVQPSPSQVVVSAPPPAPAKQENPIAVFQQVMDMLTSGKPDPSPTNGAAPGVIGSDKPER
jgi:hypothetical protein